VALSAERFVVAGSPDGKGMLYLCGRTGESAGVLDEFEVMTSTPAAPSPQLTADTGGSAFRGLDGRGEGQSPHRDYRNPERQHVAGPDLQRRHLLEFHHRAAMVYHAPNLLVVYRTSTSSLPKFRTTWICLPLFHPRRFAATR
jgi:hypothetical protein